MTIINKEHELKIAHNNDLHELLAYTTKHNIANTYQICAK